MNLHPLRDFIRLLQQPSSLGLLIMASMLAVMLRHLGLAIPASIAALGYVAAIVLSWPSLVGRNRKQCLGLLLVGLGTLFAAQRQGVEVSLEAMLSANLGLISMLVAVSFLALISQPEVDDSHAYPRGGRGLAKTLAAVHLFGSVINLSALFILADRLASFRPLSREQAIVLTRGFSAAAFWSPFFVAMGVALTYAPGADVFALMRVGLPLALLALLYSFWELKSKPKQAEDTFVGYPLNLASLWLPAVLGAIVLSLRYQLPEQSILSIITLVSPCVALALLPLLRNRAAEKLRRHRDQRVAKMGNEVALFMAAGVFSYGLSMLMQLGGGAWLPFEAFGGTEAALSLFAILIAALLGFHPVISIALVGSLVAPLNPEPNLLAVVFLASWALGSAIGPLSGMNLSIQGRYGIDALSLTRWNFRYAWVMALVVAGALQLL